MMPVEPTVRFIRYSIRESIYVIHAFQKKSRAGIATPKSEMEVIRQRLKQLRSEVKDAEKRNP